MQDLMAKAEATDSLIPNQPKTVRESVLPNQRHITLPVFCITALGSSSTGSIDSSASSGSKIPQNEYPGKIIVFSKFSEILDIFYPCFDSEFAFFFPGCF
jgi:hypothetical protein